MHREVFDKLDESIRGCFAYQWVQLRLMRSIEVAVHDPKKIVKISPCNSASE